jgi:hypothetical protein
MSKEKEDIGVNRIAYLAEQYNVIEDVEYQILRDEINNWVDSNVIESSISDYFLMTKTVKKRSNYEGKDTISFKTTIKIHEDTFISMVQADPTKNKIYLQWLLEVFVRLIKSGKIDEAKRFINEDLPSAHEHFKIFEANKRKKLFKDLCENNSKLLNITDPTNINQYKNLEQLYNVVDPFIERDVSELEKQLLTFVNSKQAEIPARDKNFTVFIPLTVHASLIFGKLTNWCTAELREGKPNGMFKTYTEQLEPNGKKSKLYIIIDNETFLGKNLKLWQLHFPSNQIMDRTDKEEKSLYDKVFEKSEILSNYFYNELIRMAKDLNKTNKNIKNKFVDYLNNFGFPEGMFDVLDDLIQSLPFRDCIIPKLPDISRFKDVSIIYIMNCKMKELHPSISKLKELETLSLPNNLIEILPDYLGECKSLICINLKGNKIKEISENIKYLDKSNGGKLEFFSVDKEDVGGENYEKLKKLLPSIKFN